MKLYWNETLSVTFPQRNCVGQKKKSDELWSRANNRSESSTGFLLTGPEGHLFPSSWCRRSWWNCNKREDRSTTSSNVRENDVCCVPALLLPRSHCLEMQESIYILARGREELARGRSKETLQLALRCVWETCMDNQVFNPRLLVCYRPLSIRGN